MKKVMYLMMFAVLLGFTMCQKESTEKLTVKGNALKDDVTKLLINNSIIYKVEPGAIWTTYKNCCPTCMCPTILSRFAVTPATQIYLNGKPALLLELKPGYKVTIYYYNNPACMESSIYGCN